MFKNFLTLITLFTCFLSNQFPTEIQQEFVQQNLENQQKLEKNTNNLEKPETKKSQTQKSNIKQKEKDDQWSIGKFFNSISYFFKKSSYFIISSVARIIDVVSVAVAKFSFEEKAKELFEPAESDSSVSIDFSSSDGNLATNSSLIAKKPDEEVAKADFSKENQIQKKNRINEDTAKENNQPQAPEPTKTTEIIDIKKPEDEKNDTQGEHLDEQQKEGHEKQLQEEMDQDQKEEQGKNLDPKHSKVGSQDDNTKDNQAKKIAPNAVLTPTQIDIQNNFAFQIDFKKLSTSRGFNAQKLTKIPDGEVIYQDKLNNLECKKAKLQDQGNTKEGIQIDFSSLNLREFATDNLPDIEYNSWKFRELFDFAIGCIANLDIDEFRLYIDLFEKKVNIIPYTYYSKGASFGNRRQQYAPGGDILTGKIENLFKGTDATFEFLVKSDGILQNNYINTRTYVAGAWSRNGKTNNIDPSDEAIKIILMAFDQKNLDNGQAKKAINKLSTDPNDFMKDIIEMWFNWDNLQKNNYLTCLMDLMNIFKINTKEKGWFFKYNRGRSYNISTKNGKPIKSQSQEFNHVHLCYEGKCSTDASGMKYPDDNASKTLADYKKAVVRDNHKPRIKLSDFNAGKSTKGFSHIINRIYEYLGL